MANLMARQSGGLLGKWQVVRSVDRPANPGSRFPSGRVVAFLGSTSEDAELARLFARAEGTRDALEFVLARILEGGDLGEAVARAREALGVVAQPDLEGAHGR